MTSPGIGSALWGKRRRNWRSIITLLVSYTAAILWWERPRYLSAVLAVAFSAVLINLQWGMLLGIYSATSIPIDRTRADIWIGPPGVPSVDMARRIPTSYLGRLDGRPEVASTEIFVLDYASWVKPDGTKENCIVIGSRLHRDAIGAIAGLTPELRSRLTEPGAVVIDEADRERLGIEEVGQTAEVIGQRVRVVGMVNGLKGLNAPYVFCSIDTARQLLSFLPTQATYLLARCHNPEAAPALVDRLSQHEDMSAFTSESFSLQTRLYWLFKTPGGLVTSFMAGLALLVGAVVTSQSLYSATLASLREYAVLRALGIPRRRIALFVLSQSAGVGLAGVVLALPIVYALGYLAMVAIGIRMILPWWLLVSVLAVTLLMAVLSGMATLRAIRLMEPLNLLR